jgi:hypothetical protein
MGEIIDRMGMGGWLSLNCNIFILARSGPMK